MVTSWVTSAVMLTSSDVLALRWTVQDANATAAGSGRMTGEPAHFARDQLTVRPSSLHENIRRPVLDDPAALQHHHAIEIAQCGETMGDGNHGAPTHQP